MHAGILHAGGRIALVHSHTHAHTSSNVRACVHHEIIYKIHTKNAAIACIRRLRTREETTDKINIFQLVVGGGWCIILMTAYILLSPREHWFICSPHCQIDVGAGGGGRRNIAMDMAIIIIRYFCIQIMYYQRYPLARRPIFAQWLINSFSIWTRAFFRAVRTAECVCFCVHASLIPRAHTHTHTHPQVDTVIFRVRLSVHCLVRFHACAAQVKSQCFLRARVSDCSGAIAA